MGRLQRSQIGDTSLHASTTRGERPAGPNQVDEVVTPSPGGRTGLAASDLVDASQERRCGEVAPSSIVGRQLGIWLASGVDGDACRHTDLGSARNKLAANASALGHVSTKNWWEKPSIGEFLTFKWTMAIPTLKQYFVLPKNGSKYYLKYTFLAFSVLGILGLGTPLVATRWAPFAGTTGTIVDD